MKEYEVLELPNGIRVVHKHIPHSKIAHCGFVLDVGSRDETKNEEGIAHFWEHMAFKGTHKRKAFHIINRLEAYGGEVNAYTTREKIYFYASALDLHFAKAMELLADITFNSSFPEREIATEKGVVLEEISMYEDAPEELIIDEFESKLFRGNSLGGYILGSRETVKSFGQKELLNFRNRNLDTSKIVFSSVGNIAFATVVRLAKKYFGDIEFKRSERKRTSFIKNKPLVDICHKPIQQAHCVLGNIAYTMHDEKRIPFFLLSNLLGGPAMTSRLNLELRERRGYVYNVETNYTSFTDTGAFYIYFGTEPKHLEKSKRVIRAELKKVREKELGVVQMHNLREQAIGQMAMAEESNVHTMQVMGKSMLNFNRVESFEAVLDKVRGISSKQILEVANEILQDDQFTQLEYLPED